MSEVERVFIVGAGAIGLPLAVHLVNHGRQVTAVRTSTDDISQQKVEITIQGSTGQAIKTPVEMVSFSKLERISGIIVVTAKSYANKEIASRLKEKHITAPIVILQNGLGVEKPYIDSRVQEIYRCILYATSQKKGNNNYSFRTIAASPIGIIKGDENRLNKIVKTLNTVDFPFRAQMDIQKEIWKKAIINSVFNSICPLLEIDNGIFNRDKKSAELAREIVEECIQVTNRLKVELNENEIMEQIYTISNGSDGQLISTLQDIKNGRETEIESLNLEISRVAEKLTPPVAISKTKLLGNMILLKSQIHKISEH